MITEQPTRTIQFDYMSQQLRFDYYAECPGSDKERESFLHPQGVVFAIDFYSRYFLTSTAALYTAPDAAMEYECGQTSEYFLLATPVDSLRVGMHLVGPPFVICERQAGLAISGTPQVSPVLARGTVICKMCGMNGRGVMDEKCGLGRTNTGYSDSLSVGKTEGIPATGGWTDDQTPMFWATTGQPDDVGL